MKTTQKRKSSRKSKKSILIYDTLKYQVRQDNFGPNQQEECLKSRDYSIITNSRFPKFNQIHFTAGDYDDIHNYIYEPILNHFPRDKTNDKSLNSSKTSKTKKSQKTSKKSILKSNLFIDYKYHYSKLYENLNYNSIQNTINYVFQKFKKGIFVAIKDNKLVCFLQISNTNYRNDFTKYLAVSSQDAQLLQQISELENNPNSRRNPKLKQKLNKLRQQSVKNLIHFLRKKNIRGINYNRSQWVANNCFFRNSFPEYEGDKLVSEYRDLIITLLQERNIPDCYFIMNIRDFPIINDDLTEPYYHLFNTKNKPIQRKYQQDSFIPILSRSSNPKSADLLMPTEDDWRLASNKIYPDRCGTGHTQNSFKQMELEWKNKKPKAIFMGGATGCGITLETNQRLNLANYASKYPEHLEVGITEWNARMKKYQNQYLDIINPKDFNFRLKKPISKKEISEYKYIIVADGHVSAFRLSYELASKSVVLLVESEYSIWYQKLLKPYENYIPIKSDLSNLIEVIDWCITHDKECKKIASNAHKLFHKYLTKKGILDYMEIILSKISNNMIKF